MILTPDNSRVAVYTKEIQNFSRYLGEKKIYLWKYFGLFDSWDKSTEILERAGLNPGNDRAKLHKVWKKGDSLFQRVCDRILKAMTSKEKAEFIARISNINSRDPGPAWSYMDLKQKRLPRNTWLIHFSSQVNNIVKEGFTKGTGKIDETPFTTHLKKSEKEEGGFSFAFIAGDEWSQRAAKTKKYGHRAVMFQSSGLEVFHEGDAENQVIYWGKAIDPRTIVELGQFEDVWTVHTREKSPMYQKTRGSVYRGEFIDVVNWVKNNWFQYHKQIMGK